MPESLSLDYKSKNPTEFREHNNLDTQPTERFDRLTRLAQRALHAPIALISLVDADREWFRSSQGLDDSETSLEVSFSAQAIAAPSLLVVRDARLDVRFRDNPCVVGAPHVRFYAGQPLVGPGGDRLGTLCVADSEPRELSNDDRATLEDLAAMVECELSAAGTADSPDVGLQRMRATLHELHALQELSQQALSSQDLPEILSRVLDTAIAIGPFDVGAVRLVNSSGDALQDVANRGYLDTQKAAAVLSPVESPT